MFAANSMTSESRDPRKPRMRLFSKRTYLNFLYLDDKLMDLPHDLAVKTLSLEKTCDLERQFGEKYLVIWASKRQAS